VPHKSASKADVGSDAIAAEAIMKVETETETFTIPLVGTYFCNTLIATEWRS
jgi:hypothetical protein